MCEAAGSDLYPSISVMSHFTLKKETKEHLDRSINESVLVFFFFVISSQTAMLFKKNNENQKQNNLSFIGKKLIKQRKCAAKEEIACHFFMFIILFKNQYPSIHRGTIIYLIVV